MEYNVVIDVIEKPPVPVPDNVASTLNDVHAALQGLPADRAANIDFPDEDAVKVFLKQAKQHSDDNGRRFTRVGDIKGKPTRVSFRVVTKRAPADTAADGTTPDETADGAASSANNTGAEMTAAG